MIIEKKIKKVPIQLNKLLFTVDEYYQMADVGILKSDVRYELLHGEIITMSPVNNPHKGITSLINELLFEQLIGKVNIQSQSPIAIDKYSHPEPDITIAHYKKHRYINVDTRPEDIHFLIEVSDSTLQKDRTLKRDLYAKAGIPEYWIINIREEQIEVFKQLGNEKYQETLILKKGEKAHFEPLGFELNVKDIFF